MRFVPIEGIQPGMVLGRKILTSGNYGSLLQAGVVLTPEYVSYLRSNGYMGVYIEDNLSKDVQLTETIPVELFIKGIEAIRTENVDDIQEIAKGITEEIVSNPDIRLDLLDLRSFDDYTLHHSVNVAIYSTMVGKRLRLTSDQLLLLCMAGISHDLGKSKIPPEVLNKPGKLTDEEFELIKSHPRHGFDILTTSDSISALVKQSVLMHHENENGTGYPYGKDGKDIPLFAKIIHVVDVYDALVSRRPYKDPYAPTDALDYLESGAGILFDPAIVEATLQVIPAYPPGIEVLLSNDEEALVVSHTEDARRPIIKLIKSGEFVDLSVDKDYQDVHITKSSIMPQDYVGSIPSLNENRLKAKDRKQAVMIVDPSPVSLAQTKNAIQGDYHFITLKSGTEVLNYLKDNKMPDLLMIEVDMPMMDGISTVMKVNSLFKTAPPTIFMSQKNTVETILRCKKAGAIDYILKPSKPIYINQRVEIALRNIVE